MKTKKFLTQLSYSVSIPEKFTGETLTIPGENYTVQELLIKHLSGQALPISKQPQWNENSDFDSPDLEKLAVEDIAVKHELRQSLQENIKEAKAKIEQAAKATEAGQGAPAPEAKRKEAEAPKPAEVLKAD